MRAKNAAEMIEALRRDVVAAVEARETYEARLPRLRRSGAYLAARRVKRASLAELLNPDTPEYGASRERR